MVSIVTASLLVFITSKTLQVSNPEKLLGLVTENDSSILGEYKIYSREKAVASMQQIIERGDDFHENYYSIVPLSDLIVHTEVLKENHSVLPIVDDAIAVDQRYIYMMEGSVLRFTICLGNAERQSISTLYGFDNEEAYENYVEFSFSSGHIFARDFEIGGQGQVICGNASYISNKTGYYFFILKAKYASTNVDYTVEAILKRLSIKDYLRKYSSCRVDQYKTSCSLKFDSSAKEWSLIGYSSPNYNLGSHLNHVRVRIVKQSKSPWNTIYGILFYGGLGIIGGGTLFVILINLTSYFLLARRRKKSYKVMYF